MSDRAKSVDLQPDIVTACMSDLTTICKDKKAKDEVSDFRSGLWMFFF